jgi:pilus assembly protein CpaE
MSQTHILVVDDSQLATKMIAALLSKLGYAATVKNDPVEALNWLRIPGNLPDLIISDVMMPAMNGHEFIRQVRADPAAVHLPVILLTAKEDMTDKIAGFQAGADDYLVKPVNAVELELRVKALLSRSKALAKTHPRSEAAIITLFSLRGGVGTTSIAVNLSIALAHLWKIQVPLLDLALKNGHCALMLNLKPKYTLSDLAEWEESTVDPEVIEKLLLNHESGVRLLPAPLSPIDAELITPAVIDRAWPYLRASYPFIVIDAGSHLTETALTALDRSHAILLLLAPELASLKAATDAIRIFTQLGYDSARILPVINWTFPQDGLPQKNIEAALGRHAAGVIPYARTAFTRAINTGRPLLATDLTSQASLAVASLAYKLSSTEMKGKETATPSQLLTWVRKLAEAA